MLSALIQLYLCILLAVVIFFSLISAFKISFYYCGLIGHHHSCQFDTNLDTPRGKEIIREFPPLERPVSISVGNFLITNCGGLNRNGPYMHIFLIFGPEGMTLLWSVVLLEEGCHCGKGLEVSELKLRPVCHSLILLPVAQHLTLSASCPAPCLQLYHVPPWQQWTKSLKL